MKQGYLGIFRKFFDHEFWKEKRQYSKAEAWIDLMQCARYGEKPENLLDKRGAYVLEYGDVYISSRYLGERWLWSRTKVTKFLEYLEKRESITYRKKDSHRTIINITNLKSYTDWIQGKREEKASDQTSEEPVESQSSDSEKPKKKKVKKDKNEKNDKNEDIYGEFKNIFLTVDQYQKLSAKYNTSCDGMIERMSQHIETKNKDPYKSHYAAILKNEDWLKKKGGNSEKHTGLNEKDYSEGIREDGSF